MMKKGPKHRSNRKDFIHMEQNARGVSGALKCYKTSVFKQIQKIFNPMAINVWRISLTEEKLHFLHYSVRGVIYALIDVLGHFSVILQR